MSRATTANIQFTATGFNAKGKTGNLACLYPSQAASTGQEPVDFPQEPGEPYGARIGADRANGFGTPDDGAGLSDASGPARSLPRREPHGSREGFQNMVPVGQEHGGQSRPRITPTDGQSGRDGGATSQGHHGPLEGRFDYCFPGRIKQSLLSHQAKSAGLSHNEKPARHALFRSG